MVLRIAIVTPETLPVPPVLGGAVQIYIDQVARRLAKKHRLTIYTVEPPTEDNNRDSTIEYITFPQTDRETYLNLVARAVATKSYQILHIFNRPVFVPTLKIAAPAAKIILNLHNDHLVKMRHHPLVGDCLRCTDHFIANSNYTKVNLLTHFPPVADRVTTIHLGLDPESFPPRWKRTTQITNIRRELGLTNRKVILFVGRLNADKGVDIIMSAMPKIIKKHPEALLLIVGSPHHGSEKSSPFADDLKNKGLELGDKVRFLGFISPSEISRLYLASDLLVCPSVWNEPFGRVNIEAMACGLPVVASARGGIMEAVQNGVTGLLIPAPPDKEHLARAVHLLLSWPEFAHQLGRNGHQMVTRYFTWDRVVKELQAVYLKITSDRRG
ncbi:MAG: glycosyltransferase family 4 protein [Clostridia bacterium]|nr:glycosyltransferase family 4 protein [Clostridia bacterium]